MRTSFPPHLRHACPMGSRSVHPRVHVTLMNFMPALHKSSTTARLPGPPPAPAACLPVSGGDPGPDCGGLATDWGPSACAIQPRPRLSPSRE